MTRTVIPKDTFLQLIYNGVFSKIRIWRPEKHKNDHKIINNISEFYGFCFATETTVFSELDSRGNNGGRLGYGVYSLVKKQILKIPSCKINFWSRGNPQNHPKALLCWHEIWKILAVRTKWSGGTNPKKWKSREKSLAQKDNFSLVNL